ncbi:MAG: hypothetical protein RR825_07105, partial [Ruthenibacterium sp.]
MAKFDVDGVQNVEVSKKLPPQMTPAQQLVLMQQYTETHRAGAALPREERELRCLNVLYPALFRTMEPDDLFLGRMDFLPIGFGCVTSLGGVGHYCVFGKLKQLRAQLDTPKEQQQLDALAVAAALAESQKRRAAQLLRRGEAGQRRHADQHQGFAEHRPAC